MSNCQVGTQTFLIILMSGELRISFRYKTKKQLYLIYTKIINFI